MKKALFTVLFLVLAVGFSTSLYAQQIQSGIFDADYNTSGFTLHENSGDRIFTHEVRFEKPFETIPNVVLGINKLEADKDTNVRVDVTATAVSRDGFVIRMKTWSDTKIIVVGGSWIAHSN